MERRPGRVRVQDIRGFNKVMANILTMLKEQGGFKEINVPGDSSNMREACYYFGR